MFDPEGYYSKISNRLECSSILESSHFSIWIGVHPWTNSLTFGASIYLPKVKIKLITPTLDTVKSKRNSEYNISLINAVLLGIIMDPLAH